ncbi:hypothetical protein ACFOTA_18885 [Chitinophaga sp. GCM10012297]|uniref:Pentapeptide MXKDX repeat protein n=1 Tax=Chitinophaga chungangae TaxID=2821488 RepID=A0ABS3YHV7_9BACT|nr:hypothetical protein [Chitinophaga chungangae]MBO9154289.1 hypothetical protein [Chitinophaga chungangae]
MKKIMFLMAAAMITVGGISVANAQAKPAAKTEQKAEKKEHKPEKKTEHHHTAKKHGAKKETPAKQ